MNYTLLDVNNSNITNMTGIEYFTSLKHLVCYDNQIMTLDVSKNRYLTELICFNNKLTELDLSKNIKLMRIFCRNNSFTQLDLSNNPELIDISSDSIPIKHHENWERRNVPNKRCIDLESNNSISDIGVVEHNTLIDMFYKKTSENMNIKIHYPQIVDSDIDSETNNRINKLIKERAVYTHLEKWIMEGLTFEQSYVVEKQENHILSIVFFAYAYVSGTAHPTDICFSITINTRTADEFSILDFVESYEYIENKIITGEYEVLYGGLKALNSDEILKIFEKHFENTYIEKSVLDFYINNNGEICIIIPLPKAGGNYSILRIL